MGPEEQVEGLRDELFELQKELRMAMLLGNELQAPTP